MKCKSLLIIVFLSVKMCFSQCRIDTIKTYSYSGIFGPKKITSQFINEYNSNDSIVNQTQQVFVTASSKWDNYRQKLYTYDSKNQMLIYVFKKWDVASVSWINFEKTENTYSNLGKIQTEKFVWDAAANQWKQSEITLFTLNSDSLVNEEIIKKWNTTGGQYVNFKKKSYTWNPVSKLNTYIFTELWSTSGNFWNKSFRITNIYGFNFKPYTIREDLWSNTTSSYNLYHLNTLKYNTNNQVIEDKSTQYNVSTMEMDSFKLIKYSYNLNKKIESQLEYTFNKSTNQWVPFINEISEYNPNNFLIANELYESWNSSTGMFIFRGRTEYLCATNTNSTNEILVNKINIFPNPIINGLLNIESALTGEFKLIDINGKTLMQDVLEIGENQYDLTHFQNGVYFIEINSKSYKIIL